VATVPKSGFNHKFCPVLLTTLILCTVGLKSKPNEVPLTAVTKVVTITVKAPLLSFIAFYLRCLYTLFNKLMLIVKP
jgi:hypothetical protein